MKTSRKRARRTTRKIEFPACTASGGTVTHVLIAGQVVALAAKVTVSAAELAPQFPKGCLRVRRQRSA